MPSHTTLTVTVSLIFAIADNGVIGHKGALPWQLPDDLRRFKALTTGHTVVMGRKTFESIGKPLPGRLNVVLTRDRGFHHDGVAVVHDLADALRRADEGEEVFVIGGAEVFRRALAKADRVYQTLVHSDVDGDTSLIEFDCSHWDLRSNEFHERDDAHAHSYSFGIYERRGRRPVS